METLQTPPLPLTGAQRQIFWLTAVVVAMTRLLAKSRTLWDWDEVQFAMAVEEYDAADYQPHPPGFPLFILLAKSVRPLVGSDFHALQTVALAGSMALFPVLFLLCRELRFPFPAAWGGALLTAFLPNVWFFGGTAFSDLPALVLTIVACALLLRGVRESRSLLLGALFLGLAAAIRPQALLTGCVPALVAVWHQRRRWRTVASAMVIGAAVITVAYAGSALASSSVEDYLRTGRKLREYVRQVDSFLSPGRPPLLELAASFFVRAIPGDRYARLTIVLAVAGALIGAARRDLGTVLLVGMFLPFQLFAWLMLDFHSVTRYGVSFAPMYGVLAASAVVWSVERIPKTGRVAGLLAVAILAALLARWSLPALEEVRRNPSPPFAAMQWIDQSVPRSTIVYVNGSAIPFARYHLKGHEQRWVDAPAEMLPLPPAAEAILVSETASPVQSAIRFVRNRPRLFDLVRQRYFEMTVIPAYAWADFAEGWHGFEWVGPVVWSWMGPRSVTHLPPLDGRARLRLRLEPVLEKGSPSVEVHMNGELFDQFSAGAVVDRTWLVDARNDGFNELVIIADRSVNPARDGFGTDGRDLSLRLLSFDWAPAP